MQSMENGAPSNGGECEWRGPEAGSLPETNPYDFVLLNLDDLKEFAKDHEVFEKGLATKAWNVLLRLYSLTPDSGYPKSRQWPGGAELSAEVRDSIPLVFERPLRLVTYSSLYPRQAQPADLRLSSLELLLGMVDEAAVGKQTEQEKAEAIRSVMGPGAGEQTVGFLRAFVNAKKAEIDVSDKMQPDG